MGSQAWNWEGILLRVQWPQTAKDFGGFLALLKIMRMYLHKYNHIPARAGRKVLGDLGCSLSCCCGLQDAAFSELPLLIGDLQHVRGGRALVMGPDYWQL